MEMLAVMRVAIAVAGAAVVLDAGGHGTAAQNTITHARDVRTALRACWVPPEDGAPQQISVRFSFSRDGQVVGQPLITYENPQPSEEGRAAVRAALAQALAPCLPLPLNDEFRKVISVHPITVRLGEGWRRRGQTANPAPAGANRRGRCCVSGRWCFLPEGKLAAGDIMLAQKIAPETFECQALTVANWSSSRVLLAS
jgi:hypothetical protein